LNESGDGRQRIRVTPRVKPDLDPLRLDSTAVPFTLEEVVLTNDDPDRRPIARVLIRFPGFRAWFEIIERASDPGLRARPQGIRSAHGGWGSSFTCSPVTYDAVCAEFVRWQADRPLDESRSAG